MNENGELPSLLGLSTDSMTELELAEQAIGLTDYPVTAFSAAALCGQDDVVSGLQAFAARNELSVFFHALDLDLAGMDALDEGSVRQIGEYGRALGSPWLTTDFAMWVWRGERLVEHMLPMPLTTEAVAYVADRIKRIQDIVQMPVVGENPPYPVMTGDLDILDVMRQISDKSGCLLCMDIGHLYILRKQRNQQLLSASDDYFPWERVVEAHISGIAPRAFRDYVLVEDQHKWPIDTELWHAVSQVLPRLSGLRAFIGESEGMAVDHLVFKLNGMGAALAEAS